jgi:hypothetical protein
VASNDHSQYRILRAAFLGCNIACADDVGFASPLDREYPLHYAPRIMNVRWPWHFGHCMKPMLSTGRRASGLQFALLHKELAAFEWSDAGIPRGCLTRIYHFRRRYNKRKDTNILMTTYVIEDVYRESAIRPGYNSCPRIRKSGQLHIN